MPKTPRKTLKPRKPRKPQGKTRHKPKALPTPSTPETIGVLIVPADDPRQTSFIPATLDDIRVAYDSVNRGAAQVSISRSPDSPSDNYVLHIHPIPEFGVPPTPPRVTITPEVPNHSNPKNIVFGPA